ncbi:hypothetical protein Hanom_Chr08g00750721 [Helianthus anomalus]
MVVGGGWSEDRGWWVMVGAEVNGGDGGWSVVGDSLAAAPFVRCDESRRSEIEEFRQSPTLIDSAFYACLNFFNGRRTDG